MKIRTLLIPAFFLLPSTPVCSQTQMERDCLALSGKAAIAACGKALKTFPFDALMYNGRGFAWQKTGDYDRAISDYSKAIELDRSLAIAYKNRGLVLELKGSLNDALADFLSLSQLAPNDPDASIKVSEIRDRLNLALKSQAPILGLVLSQSGHLKQDSRNEFIKYCDAEMPDQRLYGDDLPSLVLDPVKWHQAGYDWQRKCNPDKAIYHYTMAIKLDEKYAIAYYNRGFSWQYKGEHVKAIADFNKAIEIDPKEPLAYYNRGLSWEMKDELSQALADFVRFSELLGVPDGLKKVAEIRDKLKVVSQLAAGPVPIGQTVLTTPTPAIQASTPQPPVAQPNSVVSAVTTKRVALLIGNTRYQYAPRLENPKNDVELIAASLRKAGFSSVTIKTDLTNDQLRKALQDFIPVANSSDFSVIYYAGHAIQIGSINHLIPIDAQLKSDQDIDFQTIDAQKLLSAISGSKKLRVLVLDACRNNPFESQMKRTMASRSLGRGLGRMEADSGELIAFAAKAGEVADDGDGKNSPFAQAFAKRIEQNPPLEVRRLFDLVRDDVLKSTGRKQQPFTYGSLSGEEDYFFSR